MSLTIFSWPSLKWRTLRYFKNYDLILATFSEKDYFQDIVGYQDNFRRECPWWANSFIGEDINREFAKYPDKKKAVWMSYKSELDFINIRYIFSFLYQRDQKEEQPVTFDQCCFCDGLTVSVLVPEEEEELDFHLTPGGKTCYACPETEFTEEEKTEEYQKTRITGL